MDSSGRPGSAPAWPALAASPLAITVAAALSWLLVPLAVVLAVLAPSALGVVAGYGTRAVVLVAVIVYLAFLLGRWLRSHRSAGPLEVSACLPPDHGPRFTNRATELVEMRRRLRGQGICELSGPSGTGCSELALAYLHRESEHYPDGIFWLRGESEAVLRADLAGLAWRLDLPSRRWAEQEWSIAAAEEWLTGHRRWLLVIDGLAEDAVPALTRDIPVSGKAGGHVLITSRGPVLEAPVRLQPLAPDAAVSLLLLRSGRKGGTAAATVAEATGGLPLALELAAAYMAASGTTMADYAMLLETAMRPTADRSTAVAGTWRLSFDRVVLEDPEAADLLHLCAFLASAAVPTALLQVRRPRAELPRLLEDRRKLDGAIQVLAQYSLINRRRYAMDVPRLVQELTRDSLSQRDQRRWSGATLRLLVDAFPRAPEEPGSWLTCLRLLSHALAALELAFQLDAEPALASLLADRVAGYLQVRAEPSLARPLLERALATDERLLGPDDVRTSVSLDRLARVLRDQGDLAAARELYERALAIDERILGPDHDSTGVSLHNLAMVRWAQGELAAARPLLERALVITERAPGPNDRSTATSLYSLAKLLRELGERTTARPLLERALEIQERVLGPDHPDTATTLEYMAALSEEQGDMMAARRLLQLSLAARERTFGQEHPATARTRTLLQRVTGVAS